MHKNVYRIMMILIVLLFVGMAGCQLLMPLQEDSKPGWELVWSDEFEGSTLDTDKWDYDIGNGFYAGDQWISGWGNSELEYYTDREDNVYIDDGKLVLQAVKEHYSGTAGGTTSSFEYTSGKVVTRNIASWTYGRLEIRAKFPEGKGLWPALWMLPESEFYGSWAASGEIDIVEGWGSAPHKVAGTIHYGGAWPGNTYTGTHYFFKDGQDDATGFHEYALEWEPGEIRWYIDDVLYQTQKKWHSESADYPAPFDKDFFLIMNLAVGGHFDGDPISTTEFPAKVEIDYVRVYGPEGGKSFEEVSYTRPVDDLPPEVREAGEDGDFVNNGDFSSGLDDWIFLELPQFKGDGDLAVVDGAAQLTVHKVGVYPYAIQLIQRVPIVKGREYRLQFSASADTPRTIQVKVNGDARRNWIVYSPIKQIELTGEKQEYTIDFIMRSGTDLESRLEFNIGAEAGNVTIDDVSLSLID